MDTKSDFSALTLQTFYQSDVNFVRETKLGFFSKPIFFGEQRFRKNIVFFTFLQFKKTLNDYKTKKEQKNLRTKKEQKDEGKNKNFVLRCR